LERPPRWVRSWRSSAVSPVTIFVVEPIRKSVAAVTGSPVSTLRTPYPWA
jgi:hypothetical protein